MDHTNQCPSLDQGVAQSSSTNPSIPMNGPGNRPPPPYSNIGVDHPYGNQFPSLDQGVAQSSSTNPSIPMNESVRQDTTNAEV